MIIDLVTIFPAILDGPFRESMIKRAVEKGLVNINLIDLRSYTEDRHKQVDDSPYGGGFGMVMKPEPIFNAVEDLKRKTQALKTRVILLTPQGRPYNQQLARELSVLEHIILICGRYEGVDERVRTGLVDDEISIGDYILTGGELAAAVVVDSVVRLLPGLLAEKAAAEESFTEQLLEYPHYTRPHIFRDMEVPPVLISGNHGEIARWRREKSVERTYLNRPDLLAKADLTPDDKRCLEKLKKQDHGI
jgi:tRNA (guanine37-N1)-methyltransferase